MKKIIIILITSLIIFSCSKSNIIKMTIDSLEINGVKSRDTIYSAINDKYVDLKLTKFLIGLWRVEDYTCQNYIDSINSHYTYYNLVDKNLKEMWFNEPVDFVNYMSKNGYEMINKNESEYCVKYSFKK